MGYSIRVLTQSERSVPVAQLRSRLSSEGLNAVITIQVGEELAWDQIVLSHPSGSSIALIERNPVFEGSLAEEELQEFAEDVAEGEPRSATNWLLSYFERVKTIYAFQVVLSGAEEDRGWDALHAIQTEIWSTLGGICQADSEGFSNEDGYHILWQFAEDATGPWNMAVLDESGKWRPFQMELGDRHQRKAFKAGAVPRGARGT